MVKIDRVLMLALHIKTKLEVWYMVLTSAEGFGVLKLDLLAIEY